MPRWLAAVLLLVLGQAPAAPLPNRLPPVDEAWRDPTLVAFRQQLREVVEARDGAALTRLLYSRIENGLDAERGVRAFRQRWRLDEGGEALWPVLERLLSLGGAFVRSSRGVQFCSPYVFVGFPPELDARVHGVAVGEAVELRRAPRGDGALLRRLNHHLVRVSDWDGVREAGGQVWLEVHTLDGSYGYVRREHVMRPIDYHACFLAMSPGWRLISLLRID